MTMTVYEKVQQREKKERRRRDRELMHPPSDAENRAIRLATIKLTFWMAAAGPALARAAAEGKARRDAHLDELNEGIRKIEAALLLRDIASFQINNECRWNGTRIVSMKENHCTVLVNAPRSVRMDAIDSLLELDIENLPRRTR